MAGFIWAAKAVKSGFQSGSGCLLPRGPAAGSDREGPGTLVAEVCNDPTPSIYITGAQEAEDRQDRDKAGQMAPLIQQVTSDSSGTQVEPVNQTQSSDRECSLVAHSIRLTMTSNNSGINPKLQTEGTKTASQCQSQEAQSPEVSTAEGQCSQMAHKNRLIAFQTDSTSDGLSHSNMGLCCDHEIKPDSYLRAVTTVPAASTSDEQCSQMAHKKYLIAVQSDSMTDRVSHTELGLCLDELSNEIVSESTLRRVTTVPTASAADKQCSQTAHNNQRTGLQTDLENDSLSDTDLGPSSDEVTDRNMCEAVLRPVATDPTAITADQQCSQMAHKGSLVLPSSTAEYCGNACREKLVATKNLSGSEISLTPQIHVAVTEGQQCNHMAHGDHLKSVQTGSLKNTSETINCLALHSDCPEVTHDSQTGGQSVTVESVNGVNRMNYASEI